LKYGARNQRELHNNRLRFVAIIQSDRRMTFALEKKTLRAVGGQCPITALTFVQRLSCGTHAAAFLRLHNAVSRVQEPEIPNRSDVILTRAAAQVHVTNSQCYLQ
jgi:hypothetical protein